jgi:hypothetical protein
MLRQEVEATLHCVMSIQEAVPLEPNKHLSLLFGSDVLGRLPTSGNYRVQRTMLGLIGISQTDSGISSIHSIGKKKVPSPRGSQPSLQDQANPCLPSWATWCPR